MQLTARNCMCRATPPHPKTPPLILDIHSSRPAHVRVHFYKYIVCVAVVIASET